MIVSHTLLLSDLAMVAHDPGPGHPEQPPRLARILELLRTQPVEGCVLRSPRKATAEELGRVHTLNHLQRLEQLAGHRARLDPDTAMSEASFDAALLAAGAGVQAVQEVQRGSAVNAFALVRPPGHHAEPDRAMGFCLFNNAAVAAEAALAGGARRVLVLDWDVHHGNGTQAAFWGRADVLYMSAHQFPYYPGTGAPHEIGEGQGRGYTVNCGLGPGRTDADYGAVFDELFLPIAHAYAPDVVIASAGFDAHAGDPLGGMLVSERGFAAMTTRLVELARGCAGGKLVLLLEGGYHLGALARSVHACASVLAGVRDEFPRGVSREAAEAIAASRAALSGHWEGLRS
jgi:acetoin utilization deacetylase AcuC-like enzyme